MGVTAVIGGQSYNTPGGPPYYSGTNCTVGYRAVTVPQGTYLTDVKFYIGDQLIPTPPLPAPPNQTTSASGTVRFDSSRFMDAFGLTIRVVATNNLGATASQTSSAKPVYNKVYVLGNSTLTYGVAAQTDIGIQAALLNYATTNSSTVVKAAILAEIPNETAFYIYTHAGPGWFKDCPNTGTITAGDVSTAVNSKTSSQPPYNFVHIDGCNSCGSVGSIDTSLADAFKMSGTDDRAFLGWLSNVDDTANNESWSKTVWSGLKAGKTVDKAATDANAAYTPKNPDGSTATWKILGDTRTTLHATYFLSPTEGLWHD